MGPQKTQKARAILRTELGAYLLVSNCITKLWESKQYGTGINKDTEISGTKIESQK